MAVMYMGSLSVTIKDKGDPLRLKGEEHRAEMSPDSLLPGVLPRRAHSGGKFKRPFGSENVRKAVGLVMSAIFLWLLFYYL